MEFIARNDGLEQGEKLCFRGVSIEGCCCFYSLQYSVSYVMSTCDMSKLFPMFYSGLPTSLPGDGEIKKDDAKINAKVAKHKAKQEE